MTTQKHTQDQDNRELVNALTWARDTLTFIAEDLKSGRQVTITNLSDILASAEQALAKFDNILREFKSEKAANKFAKSLTRHCIVIKSFKSKFDMYHDPKKPLYQVILKERNNGES